MILEKITSLEQGNLPLRLVELPVPEPKSGEVLVKISACGVCHTELDEIEGRTALSTFPVVPGHQVVSRVEKQGRGVRSSYGRGKNKSPFPHLISRSYSPQFRSKNRPNSSLLL